jgi:hypothetical protein
MKIAFIYPDAQPDDLEACHIVQKNEDMGNLLLTQKLMEQLALLEIETTGDSREAEVFFFCIPCSCCSHRVLLNTMDKPVVVLNISPCGDNINLFGTVQNPTAENIANAATEAKKLGDLLLEQRVKRSK